MEWNLRANVLICLGDLIATASGAINSDHVYVDAVRFHHRKWISVSEYFTPEINVSSLPGAVLVKRKRFTTVRTRYGSQGKAGSCGHAGIWLRLRTTDPKRRLERAGEGRRACGVV